MTLNNKEAAAIIKGMLERRGRYYGREDEIYDALERAVYVLLNPDCRSCDYFLWDEGYDFETEEEFDLSACLRKEIEEDDRKRRTDSGV